MSVGFDAKPTAWNSADGLNQQATGATSISASTGFAVGAGASALVATITYQNAVAGGADPGALTSVTWNGVSRTGLLESGASSDGTNIVRTAIAWWAGMATGTQTLAAAWPNAADAYMGVASFTGVDTTTPVVTADNVTGLSGTTVTVPSDANGASVAAWGTNGSTPTLNFNKIYAEAPLRPAGAASYQLGGTSNGHTFTGAGGTLPAWAGIHLQATAATGTSDTPRVRPLLMKLGQPGKTARPWALQTFLPSPPPYVPPVPPTIAPLLARFEQNFGRQTMGRVRPKESSPRNAFTLSADPGTYILTGQAATVLAARSVSASAGVYALTGKAASLLKGYAVNAASGAYTLSGVAATLRAARLMNAAAGAYAITGRAAATLKGYAVGATAGAYTLTGVDAQLLYSATPTAYVLSADAGAYALSGNASTLDYTQRSPIDGSGLIVTSRKPKRRRALEKDRSPEDYERERKMLEQYLESLEQRKAPPQASGVPRAQSAPAQVKPAAVPRLTAAMARAAHAHELELIEKHQAARKADRERAEKEHHQRRRAAAAVVLMLSF